MSYLFTILICALLLSGFLFLTAFETRRGVRLFLPLRLKLDRHVGRVTFIVTHVDLGAFVVHLVHSVAERIAHDLAHGALVTVRFLERLLTRIVRLLRARIHERMPDSTQPSPLVEKVSHIRQSLRHAREVKEEAVAAADAGEN